MTSTQLERLIRERLDAVGLSQALNDYKSQFLDFPDGFFVELVLNDGTKLVEVERITREVRDELGKQNIELDVIVRSLWIIQHIEGPNAAIGFSGGIEAVWTFSATLVSGSLKANIEVAVTHLAVREIKRRIEEGSLGQADEKDAAREVVKEFLKLQISFGGESYWDPMRHPQQELNESALLYLFGHSAVGKR